MLLLRGGNRPQGVILVAVFEQVPQPKGRARGKLRLAPCSFSALLFRRFFIAAFAENLFRTFLTKIILKNNSLLFNKEHF